MAKKVVDLKKLSDESKLKGDFANLQEWIGKEINITAFKIIPNAMFGGEYVIFQVENEGQEPFLLSVGSAVVVKQAKDIEREFGNKDVLIKGKIEKIKSSSGREYYSLEPVD